MKLAFPVLALFLFAACGAGAASKVAGIYTIDTNALIAGMPAAADKEKAKELEKGMREMFDSMSFDLAADGTTTFKGKIMGNAIEEKGTWKLDGDKITITTKDKDSGKDETKSGTFKDGVITVEVTEPDMPFKKMVLRKK